MPIPWTVKKQLAYLSVLTLVIIGALFFVWLSATKPTCFDNKQNQGEENVDCGGPCEACLGEIKNLIVVWSKEFQLKNGEYETAALIKNPNLFLGISSLKYKFTIYDANNILIAAREGDTFINPGEQYVVFESGIDTGERVPKSAFIELEENPRWKRIEKEIPQIVVSRKDFFNEPYPRLAAEISNKSIFPVSDISAVAVLYDDEGNAKAVSSTKISLIEGDSSRQVVFTWNQPFLEEYISSDIFLRINLTRED